MRQHVGLVGTGYWGKNLVRVFSELGALAAVCDSDQGRLDRLGLAADVRRYEGYEQLLEDTAVDAVVIATPAAAHYKMCRQALEAGRDVMVEKPLALSVEQGQELVQLAEERGRILMVGHILRYHPAVGKLVRMIADGELGRVEYVYSNRLNLGKLRTEENILWSFAPHDISVILALVAERPVIVSSHGEAFLQRNVFDVTLTAIEFPNGVKAHTFVSWLHPFKEQRLVVVGSEQMAVFEDSRPQDKLVCYPHRVQWQAGKVPVAMKGERRVIEVSDAEPLLVECEHFLESCETRIPPRTDGYEGLAVLEVLATAEASLKQGGKPVPLPAGSNGRCRHALCQAVHSSRQLVAAAVPTNQSRTQLLTNASPAMTRSNKAGEPAAGDSPLATLCLPCGVERRAEIQGTTSEISEVTGSRWPASGILHPEVLTETGAGRGRDRGVEAPDTRSEARDCFIHPTAVVDDGAEIGAGSKVWHYTHVSTRARIGPRNILGQNVFVAEGVVTGANCKVQNNVSLYKGVVLEDDVFCGPSCVFTNVINPRAFLEKKSEFRPTLVKQGASIGANATVVCGHTLGRYCLIGAGAVVTRDVPDYALMIGVPARQQGWVCRCGERLRLAAGQTGCQKCGEQYEMENGKVKPRKALGAGHPIAGIRDNPDRFDWHQIRQESGIQRQSPGLRVHSASEQVINQASPPRLRDGHRSATIAFPMLDLKREYMYMKVDIDRALERVLEHQAWIMGPEVRELEAAIAQYVGTKYAVSCASGTDALVLALRSLALKRTGREYFTRQEEIITTPFTFTATGDAILRAGATPVFVDIEPTSFNIDPEKIRSAVNERTVGILPVHLYGQVCAMDEIIAIARARSLFIVEDCAQSFGADLAGRKCGSFGDCAAFSFFPSKNLGGFGDGGMVTTNDADLARLCDMLRKHGGRDKYNVDQLGYNSRLDTLQGAILLAKLRYVDSFNDRRRRIAAWYNLALQNQAGVKAPALPRNGEHVFHQYTIRIPEAADRTQNTADRRRDRVAKKLAERGIASMVYYPVPLHKMRVFAGRSRAGSSLAESERAAAEVLSLPIEPLLSHEEVQTVIAAMEEALECQETVA